MNMKNTIIMQNVEEPFLCLSLNFWLVLYFLQAVLCPESGWTQESCDCSFSQWNNWWYCHSLRFRYSWQSGKLFWLADQINHDTCYNISYWVWVNRLRMHLVK